MSNAFISQREMTDRPTDRQANGGQAFEKCKEMYIHIYKKKTKKKTVYYM